MSMVSRLRDRLRRLKLRWVHKNSIRLPREFVYLDEVSVCSILASRKGGIATEFTESQTATLNSSVSGSSSVGIGATNARLDSELRAGHVHGSQVLRKAIIQTSFKELYDVEGPTLAMSSPDTNCMPTISAGEDLGEILDRSPREGWVVDPSTIGRGELLEVEVELGADPIFRLASIITTFQELVGDNEVLFGNSLTSQLAQMHSIAQVLERLLVGLIPIRGRLVHYMWVNVHGRDVLVHRLLLEQISPTTRPETHAAFLVGVAERALFWKDIRQVLFAQAQYTVFCRLATSGLADRWNPVKAADVLGGIVPQFDELIGEFSERACQAMATPADAAERSVGDDLYPGVNVIREYVKQLANHHTRILESDVIDDVVGTIVPEVDWLSSVDSRRPVFAEVTQRMDDMLKTDTSAEVACDLRQSVIRRAGLLENAAGQAPIGIGRDRTVRPSRQDRFLDAEIIAIYW